MDRYRPGIWLQILREEVLIISASPVLPHVPFYRIDHLRAADGADSIGFCRQLPFSCGKLEERGVRGVRLIGTESYPAYRICR